MSIQETAGATNHKMSFYNNSSTPEYRFNLRFVRSEEVVVSSTAKCVGDWKDLISIT